MSTEPKTNQDAIPPAKPRRKRWWLRIVLGCFALLVLLVLLAPTLVSSGWGTNLVMGIVNKGRPGTIDVEDLSLGWFSGTRLSGLTVTDPEGVTLLTADVDAPDLTLLSLMGGMTLGDVTINASQLDLVQYDDGSTNLQRALGPSQAEEDERVSIPEDLSVNLRLTAPRATYSAPGSEQAVVTDLDVQADIASPQAITAAIKASVSQGQYSGAIDGHAVLNHAFDEDGILEPTTADVDANFAVRNLPTQMISSLAKQGDKLTILAGPELTTTIAAKGKLTDLLTELSVTADRLKVNSTASVSLTNELKLAKLAPRDGQLAWLRVTPQSHAAWVQRGGKLTKPFEITVTQKNVSLIAGDDGLNLPASRGTLDVAVTPIHINTGAAEAPDESQLDIRQMQLSYDGPGGLATAIIEAVARQGEKSGVLLVKVDATKPFDKNGDLNYETLKLAGDVNVKDFALAVIDDLVGADGLVTGMLGDVLNAHAQIALTPSEGGEKIDGTWSLTASSNDNRFTASLTGGRITATRSPAADGGEAKLHPIASLTEPGVVEVAWSQKTLNLLAEHFEALKPLAARVTTPQSRIRLTIDKLSAPLDATLARRAEAKMALTAGDITVDLNQEGQTNDDLRVTLSDTAATVTYSGAANALSATLDAVAATAASDKKGTLTAKADIAGLFNSAGELDTKALAPKVTARITDLPTAIADAFTGDGRLAYYGIGPTLSATLTTQVTQAAGAGGEAGVAGPVKITATGQNLEMLIDARLEDGRLILPKPADSYITLTATPQLFEEFMASREEATADSTAAPAGNTTREPAGATTDDTRKVTLAGPSKISIAFTQFDMPLDAQKRKQEGKIGMVARIDQIVTKGDDRLTDAAARDVVATLAPSALSQPLKVAVTGDLFHGEEKGALKVDATVARAMEEDRTIDATVTLTDAPTALVDALAGQNGKLIGLLGATISSLKLKSNTGGEIVAHLESPNAFVDVAGLYTDETRRLTDDAVAKIQMNEVLSNLLFEPMTGGLLSAEKSDKPVIIVVGKDGFAVGPGEFDVSKLTANVSFDFNSMKLKPLISVSGLVPAGLRPIMQAAGVGGTLESELAGFLGKFDKYMPTFGPFKAKIKDGILTYEEPMTFTMDKFTVKLDGTVNLKTKVPQLSLGFPKAALSSKLQRFTGSEGHLYVPFTQVNGRLTVDSSKFGEVLKSAFNPAKLLGGDDGKPDVGGLIEGILGGRKDDKDDKKAPAPNAPNAPVQPAPKEPDIGSLLEDLIGGKKKDDREDDKKTPPKSKDKVDPDARISSPPPAPAPPVDAAKLTGLNPGGQRMYHDLIALQNDRTKFAEKLDDLAASGDLQSLYAIVHVATTLPSRTKFKAGDIDVRDPKWAAYQKMKRTVNNGAFGDLGSAYVKALAEDGKAEQEAAALVQWLRERESKLKWNGRQWVLEK